MKFLIALFLFSGVALAKETGNGGHAIVCRNPDGSIRSAQLLDLYEWDMHLGLEYELPAPGSSEEVNLMLLAQKIYPYSAMASQALYNEFLRIKGAFHFIRSGHVLEKTLDAFPAFTPRGCEVEQLANYYNRRTIFINSDIYNALGPVDQVGLIVHETIYYLDRLGNVESSEYARHITALAMSKTSPFGIREVLSSPGQMVLDCRTDQKRDFIFTLKQLDGRPDRWTISFLKVNGHPIYATKQGIVDLPNFENGTLITEDEHLYGSRTSNSTLRSKILDGDDFIINIRDEKIDPDSEHGLDPKKSYKRTTLRFKWSSYLPEDDLTTFQEAFCFPRRTTIF